MILYHNISPGEYVHYEPTTVWRVEVTKTAQGDWEVRQFRNGFLRGLRTFSQDLTEIQILERINVEAETQHVPS